MDLSEMQARAAELEQQAETLQSRLNETAAEKQETAEKAAKAEELGIPMLNEDQFKQLLDTGTVE